MKTLLVYLLTVASLLASEGAYRGTVTISNRDPASARELFIKYQVQDRFEGTLSDPISHSPSYTVQPGETVTVGVSIPYDTTESGRYRLQGIGIFVSALGYGKDGASYVVGSTGEDSSAARFMQEIRLGRDADPGPINTVVVQSPYVQDGAKKLWTVPSDEVGTLNAQIFREGIDMVVAAVGEGSGGSGGGGGGGGTNSEAYALQGINAAAASSGAGDASNAAVTAYTTAFDTYTRQANNPVAVPPTSSPDDFWVVHMPKGDGTTYDLDLNPFHVDGISEIAAWVRLIVSIAVIAGFEIWLYEQFDLCTRGLTNGTQAHGNTVAGSGGQVTGVLNATILATIWTSIPTLVLAFYTTSFGVLAGVSGFVTELNVMPTGSNWLAAGFYGVNQFIPTTLMLAVFAQAWLVRRFVTKIYVLAAIAMKYAQF